MSSIVSKLARAAAVVACRRASPTAVRGGKHPVSPWPFSPGLVYPASRRMSSDTGNTSEKVVAPNPPLTSAPESAAAVAAATTDPRTDLNVSSAEALESDETLWALYEHCCKHHEMHRDRAEMERRFRTFKRNARHVHKVNSTGASYTAGLSRFADLTRQEIAERMRCSNNACSSGVHERHQLPDDVVISSSVLKNTSEVDGPPKPPPPSSESAAATAASTIDRSMYPRADAETLESDEALWSVYEYWCKFHGKSRDHAEMKRRFKTFKKSAIDVHEFNSSCVSGRMGLTQFADMTKKELRRMHPVRRRTRK